MSKYYYLYEQTKTTSNNNLEILNEAVVNNRPKISFRSVLQEAEMKNQNKRLYPEAICESIVEKLTPKIQNRSLLMEADHPLFVSKDPDVLKRRSTIVEWKNACAEIRDLKYLRESKKIIGENIVTLSGCKGPDLASLILDGVNIGFSLRALGSVEMLSDGTMRVQQPFVAITYDAVTSPSHDNARILEVLPESLNDFITKDQDLLYEADGFKEFIENEGVSLDKTDNDVRRFLNEIINEQFHQVISKKIYFKL